MAQEKCPSCKGKGKVLGVVCSWCGGSGKAEHKTERRSPRHRPSGS